MSTNFVCLFFFLIEGAPLESDYVADNPFDWKRELSRNGNIGLNLFRFAFYFCLCHQ